MSQRRIERLLNLVFVLASATKPITRDSIRARVPGYSDSQAAFERMFERDKEELRMLGVPVDTRPVDELFDDEVGYVMPPLNGLPFTCSFTPQEVALIRLAERCWADEELRSLARFGAIWSESRSEGHGEAQTTEVAVSVSSLTAKVLPIIEALSEAELVRFDYQKASGHTSTRTVKPRVIAQDRGAWYLWGTEVSDEKVSGVEKSWRISRIVSVPARLPSKSSDAPTQEEALSRAESGEDASNEATLELSEHASVNALRFWSNLTGGSSAVANVMFWSEREFAATLLPYLPHIRVLQPRSLRDSVASAATEALKALA